MKFLKNLVFLDIETVSGYSSHDELPENLKELWQKKASFLRKDDDISDETLYFDKAAIYSEFGKIICISVGILYYDNEEQLHVRIKSISSDSEEEVLKKFVELLHGKMDEAAITLVGHNAKEFDFPYIGRRMIVNKVPLPPYLDLSGKKPWEVNHIDTMEMWKFGDRKSFTSLALLTAIFDIPSPKEDINGADVNRVYYLEDGLARIAKYCNRDVLATVQVYLRIKGLAMIDDVCVHYVEEEAD